MYLKLYQEFRDLFKKTKFWENNYLFLREFKTFRKIAILALVFSFLGATFEGISIGFLLSFLQNITTVNATPIHTGIEWFDIWVLGIKTSTISRLYRISTLIILTTWLRVLFNYLGNLYTEIAQLQLGDRLRKQVFEQLEKVSLSYFSKTRSGDLINTITTEIEKIKYSFSAGSFLLTRTLNLSVYLISIIFISWQLTICSVLLFTLLGVALSTLNAKVREESFSLSSANSKFTSTAIEFINGIRTIQAFGTQQFERKRYYEASEEVVKTYTKVTLIGSLLKPITEGVGTTFLVGMIIFAFTVFVANGTLQVASLLGFFFVLFRIVPIVQDVNGVRGTISMLQGSVDKVKSLLTTEDKVYFHNGTLEFKGLKRSIDLISVDFGYDANNLVLHNITLSIERGKTTALVGGSGAGKTTLADIVARFYDPTEGNVLIDGTDLRQYEINTLRHKMAIVSQDTFIFNTSIWNNISYGTSEVREDEIREAARLANALEFILEMPEGFETQLGDRGVRLSGGQRQRIAIARALLRNPEILILDEATSALDSLSERLIQESLEKLSVGRTVIAIAHRLSTIAKADKVVVLEQGRLVEQGSYQELLNQRGKLWEYHKTQYQELGQTE